MNIKYKILITHSFIHLLINLDFIFLIHSSIKMLPQVNNSQPAHHSKQASVKSKKQTFYNEIRRNKRIEYKQRIRARLMYGNDLDYDILHKVNLLQSMNIIKTYSFNNNNNNNSNSNYNEVEIDIDSCSDIYDLELGENTKLKQAIEGVYLYVTSSMSDHALHLLDEIHVYRLAEIIDRKVENMRSVMGMRKSLKEMKQYNNPQYTLPLIYEKLMMILAHWSYEIIFQEANLFLINILNKLIHFFPLQTRIVQCATYCLVNSFDKPKALQDIMRRLNDQQGQNCVLTRIIQIFEFQTKHFDEKSFHSSTVITTILHFYAQLFRHIKITAIYPQMKRKIYKSFHKLLTYSFLSDQINLQLLKTLMELYSKNFGPLSHILLETKQIFMEIVDLLYSGILAFNSKMVFEKKTEKKQILILCFQILKTVFEDAGQIEEIFVEVCEFLSNEVDDKIDRIMQQGLKSSQQQIINHTLQLTKYICLWGDFISKVQQNYNIMIKLFYYSEDTNIKLKKQSMLCLFNIIEGYFEGNNFYDSQLCDIYQTIFERYKFLDTLVGNLDLQYDKELNVQILNCVRIMGLFWQVDPQLQRENVFWIKFVELGGELKLNRIVTENRGQEMQHRANQILQIFANKQIQI